MKRIAILYFDHTPLSAIATPLDIFLSVGVFWNQLFKEQTNPEFSITLATPSGKAANCSHHVSLAPHCGIEEIQQTDVVIIMPTIPFVLPNDQKDTILPWLRFMHKKGAILASVCTGAFLLAETGLLNGRTATTHWALANKFQNKYPQVNLQISSTVTDEQDLLCSGGASAGADLALHLVRKFCSSEIAFQCAKALLLEPRRSLQLPYHTFNFDKSHGDIGISAAQDWIEKHYHEKFSIDSLALRIGLSRRTLERKFRRCTGDSPLKYVRKIRVESAKLLLETTQNGFDEITNKVGYEDCSTFRKVFVKTTGITPSQYRDKFCRHMINS